MAAKELTFECRSDFRNWLEAHCASDEGVWLIFGKAGGPKTLTASEALEEALASVGSTAKCRRSTTPPIANTSPNDAPTANGQEKNKKLVAKLEKCGLMTERGHAKIEEAKANGQWNAPKAPAVTEADIERIAGMLEPFEPAHTKLSRHVPLLVRKTYTRAYLDAKTDAGREKRLAWMIDRLNQNLKPM